jgi:hypothetical protein
MATHAVTTGWDRCRLIYGDWNWLVRDGLDVRRYVFIAGTLVFVVVLRAIRLVQSLAARHGRRRDPA